MRRPLEQDWGNDCAPESLDAIEEMKGPEVLVRVVAGKTLKSIKISPDTLVAALETKVREELGDIEDLELVLQCNNGKAVSLTERPLSTRFKDLLDLSTEFTYTLVTKPLEKQNMALLVNDAEDDLLLGASASPTAGEVPSSDYNDVAHVCKEGVPFNDASFHDRCLLPIMAGPSNDAAAKDEYDAVKDELAGANYVGLVNQAMTCYLNSLVQALYMTPEFRNAIYNWEFDGQNETRSIPYQLQKLFLNLQTSTRSAVETTDLTTSFGWQGSEAWHQHDIQELCRVMFDALERKFKDTKQANLINDLYMGTWLDYVKCLECGTEKSREDTFLDIPLPVRPFGSNVAYNSVEEALRAFVQPETLDGNNQYLCEKCGKKCDAHKGLKFIKFPYLLTLHLKRFDFDYNTMHRIKLNDKVVFPEKLNLNSFVPNSRCENEHLEERDNVVKCDDCSTTDSGSALDDESCQGTDVSSSAVNDHDCEDSDEGIDVSSGNTHHEPEAKGPYVYELFSIMIHSGSASGGHYYAYIKDFEKNHWLCFNDQSVNKITEDDIQKTYGGGPQKAYYSGMYTSSTNAYMLMYRRIDKDRNCNAIQVDEFPPHVQTLLELMRNKETTEKARRERQNNFYKLTVYCQHPITDELLDVRINMYHEATLEDAAEMAHRRLKLEGIVDLHDCRLVVYNKKHSCVDTSFESGEIKLCDIADSCNMYYSDWLLDIREAGTEFKSFKKGGIALKAYHVVLETEDVKEPVLVRIDVGDTVKDVKNSLGSLLNVDPANMKVVMEKLCGEPQVLEDDTDIEPIDKIFPEYKLYVSSALDEDSEKKFEHSKLKKVIDKFESVVHLTILLPDTDAATLETLFIPSLDPEKSDPYLTDPNTNSPNLRISPQPNAPTNADSFGGDQSNSEDSSLSDSDRTLVGDAPDCVGAFSSSSDSPADQHMTSPSDPPETDDMLYVSDILTNGNGGVVAEDADWDQTTSANLIRNYTYFKVTSVQECKKSSGDSNFTRMCKVFVDSRMTLYMLKKYLEPVVRVPKEHFKIFRHHPSPDEEWTNLSDTLQVRRDGQTLTVKLGRALSPNEYSCKVYLLRPDNSDTTQFLFEHILSRGQAVGQVKKEILFKAKKQHMLDIPFNKCRLREKCVKKPRKVYLDDQVFLDDIIVLHNYEIFLQELVEPERVTSTNQVVLFARHWCPSSYTLKPYEEVVLDSPMMAELKVKVSGLSEIPLENVEVAFVRNIFPCDVHLLDVNSVLEWNPNVTHLDQWPMHAESGTSFFYRDNREQLKELTAEEKKEINIRENARLGRFQTKVHNTWETSLRIYTDNWPPELEDNCID